MAELDPRTGYALPLPLSTTLRRIGALGREAWAFDGDEPPRDRLWRIAQHAQPALLLLLHNLGESPARERAVLPIRSVRELDQASFMALSRRPGRTVREKLASKPYLQAVRHYQSIDLPQNRLVKAFCLRMSELLSLREQSFGYQDDLLPRIDSWLRSPQAEQIGRWENLPPNNTLLSHRQYRAVWDAWRWLQTLDDDVARDWESFDERQALVEVWTDLARSRFADQPLAFDIDKLSIEPWDRLQRIPADSAPEHRSSGPLADSAACIDLVPLFPRYAISGPPTTPAPFPLLWQHWESSDSHDKAPVDIELIDAEGVWNHTEATTVSATLLFEDNAVPSDQLDRAARSMAATLKSEFRHGTLHWLAPDIANDFTLEVLRRNLNSQFADAQPLPRSVATIFAQLDLSSVSPNFAVVVLDSFAGTRYATKLVAHLDEELRERSPDTYGICWEREPSVRLGVVKKAPFPLWRLNATGTWRPPTEAVPAVPDDVAQLKRDPLVGAFDLYLAAGDELPAGGVRFGELQRLAGTVPLWRDHLPELSIEVMSQGVRHDFALVSRKQRVAVDPRRGVRTHIPIDARFVLPPGRSEYRFQLVQGGQGGELEYDAVLRSQAFPRTEETECRLELTYEYGADDPYVLRFTPVDASFAPVRAAWRAVSDRPPVDVTSLPIPPFPPAGSWAELEHWPRDRPGPNGETTSDLLEWAESAFASLDDTNALFPDRVTGEFYEGRLDHDGNFFCSVLVDGENVHCHSRNFSELIDGSTLSAGDPVFLVVNRQQANGPGGRDRLSGRQVTFSTFAPPGLVDEQIRQEISKARYPTYTIWNHGRSIDDADCPAGFRHAVQDAISNAERLIAETETPDLKSELTALLSRMHKDAPESIHRDLLSVARRGRGAGMLDLSYGLGDCSLPWQHGALNYLANNPEPDVRALAVVLWRSSEPVHMLSVDQVDSLLRHMAKSLPSALEEVSRSALRQSNRARNLKGAPPDQRQLETAVRKALAGAELLLALLRTRESDDIRMKSILSPDSEHGKAFIAIVDQAIKVFAEKRYELHSRVTFELSKPAESAQVPDLLYALRLYLTGDDGASAIRIAGVSDDG
ncbi:hypothetical protein [Cellulomonas humilata]|uniref:hypothetical protein n=1 Tax=Cellulomonas humilata TaxID=144055 RepID=UPI0027D91519|nr:hypothetical protein [Cellulomonas humilata]